jgi:hypothetical protein
MIILLVTGKLSVVVTPLAAIFDALLALNLLICISMGRRRKLVCTEHGNKSGGEKEAQSFRHNVSPLKMSWQHQTAFAKIAL